jgi:predicted nucleotidyltransferase
MLKYAMPPKIKGSLKFMKNIEKTSLLKNERDALQQAVLFMKENYPLDKIILFGSKARGDSDQYSDIDILLITSRQLNWREEKQIVESLYDIGLKHDVIFSPLFASSSEWEEEVFRQLPIYKEIVSEGAVVA